MTSHDGAPVTDRLRRDVRLLKAYAMVSTLAFTVVALAAFRQPQPKQRFGEIDVERLNIIEPDGTPRFVLSNTPRFPGLIIRGKEYEHPRNEAGILFFNAEGSENGGLYASGKREGGRYSAGGGILFDQYDQDQTIGIQYSDANGQRSAGLTVWDRPDTPLEDVAKRLIEIRAMPEGAARTKAMTDLRAANPGPRRVVVGKNTDRSAMVMLADAQGKPRLRMLVDSAGGARIEFLDANGRVTSALPARAP